MKMSIKRIVATTLVTLLSAATLYGCAPKQQETVVDDWKYDYSCVVYGNQVQFSREKQQDGSITNILEEGRPEYTRVKYYSFNNSVKLEFVQIIQYPKNNHENWLNKSETVSEDSTKTPSPIIITYHSTIKEELPIIRKAQAHYDSIRAEITHQKVEKGLELLKK